MSCAWCTGTAEYIAAFGSSKMEVWSVAVCWRHAAILAQQGGSVSDGSPIWAPLRWDADAGDYLDHGRIPWAVEWEIRKWAGS